ncbi:hypothetical protein, partial [Salipiger aestuarii]|uniref:hypothetical protein n=1 Tax=Salipiger aestuarii TaxID=568098 RepID=UPI00123C3AEF
MSVTLTWPTELDPPERDSWRAQWDDARAHRSGDGRPSRYGRRMSAVSKRYQMSIVCTSLQRAIFWRFHDRDTRRGALLFWMPDPSRDGWPLAAPNGAALLTPGGAPLLISARWLCLFG